ncbi:hypothetical protein [Methyloversatilis discipulorum]|uniref:hypothetical protein n=1 Tax=Methyloversatilis discipulorum TaxID=1119528 RepID=UPI002A41FE20|nr:hypothetical protein [Methyloversatilis sp.]
MARSKAQYKGDGVGSSVEGLSAAARMQIRALSGLPQTANGPWSSPADQFIEAVSTTALWAAAELHFTSLEVTKEQLKLELEDIVRRLKRARQLTHQFSSGERKPERIRMTHALRGAATRLRAMSLPSERVLSPVAEPLSCAEVIESTVLLYEQGGAIEAALPRLQKAIDSLLIALEEARVHLIATRRTWRVRRDESERATALELAIQALRIMKKHGIEPSSTTAASVSTAVLILKTLGDDIGINREEATWHEIVLDAKAEARDLAG